MVVLLVALIPIVGAIWILILLCTDSDLGENEYGANPEDLQPGYVSSNSNILDSDIHV